MSETAQRSERWPWRPGSATGVGSLPGTEIGEALRTVLGELPDFPYLPELPARGWGADLTGRAGSLLVGLHVERLPSGWRLVDRPGTDQRRAEAHVRRDLDLLEELTQGYRGPLKIQVAGPWTVAATVELPTGTAAVADRGACRDLADSLAEGVAGHVTEIRRRVPGAEVVLQLDEPALPSVLAGAVPRPSGWGTLAPVESPVAARGLGRVLGAAEAAGATTVAHCCAADPPVGLMVKAGARALSVDALLVRPATAPRPLGEELAAAVEDGCALFLGVLPAVPFGPVNPAAAAQAARGWWRWLGLDPKRLPEVVVVTPGCGLAGAVPEVARAVTTATREVGRRLLEDPQG